MAVEVYQPEIAVAFLPAFPTWFKVVDVQFFVVVERFSTYMTPMVLAAGEFLPTGEQVFGFRRVPFPPVLSQTRIIG
jgi:hypothetical protein